MRTFPQLRIREVRNHRIRPPPSRNDPPKELVGGPTTSTTNATTDTAVRDHYSLPARQGDGNGRRTVTTSMRQQGADPIRHPAPLRSILDTETRDIARRDTARRRADGTPDDNPRWITGEEEGSASRNTEILGIPRRDGCGRRFCHQRRLCHHPKDIPTRHSRETAFRTSMYREESVRN